MKRWLKYVKPYWPYFILGPLCMIVEVIGEVLMPKYLSMIVDETPTADSVWKVVGIAGMMVLTALLMMAGGVGGAWFGAKASVNFGADLRQDVYNKVQTFSFTSIDKFSTGSLVTRLTNDITQMQNFINMLLRMALRSPGMLIGALIMAITMNARLSVVLAVAIPLLLTTQALIISKGFPRFSKMQDKIDALNNTVQENLTNVRVVKSFVREDKEKEKFSGANKRLKKSAMDAMGVMILMHPFMSLFMQLTTAAVVWFGGNQIVEGSGLTPGDLVAFITYINQILMSLMMVSMLFINASRALASSKRIAEVLDEQTDISDENAACPEMEVTGGDVTFQNVTFRYYKNSENPVLDDISLHIKGGSTVGLIGSTGCGKTTLVSLIARLYDPDEGQVLVDGVDVKDYSLYNLRSGVGMVLQKNVLFSGTIEDNLRWGDETADDDRLRQVAQSAQADGFITSFTDGYQTVLGQGGVNVSGGQKQRLCIARALLKNPKILILDDSTSAVDTATEARIRETFETSLKHTTKIIIAQRISSVQHADQIIVMSDGKITGVGTHEELLKTNEEYLEIYESQTGKGE
ncbi:MAG: ABC transporter ATP-binding protein [Clostridia bacterium]|nr:ABC transporter ATP-binding protein [Clostridia bacterium]